MLFCLKKHGLDRVLGFYTAQGVFSKHMAVLTCAQGRVIERHNSCPISRLSPCRAVFTQPNPCFGVPQAV